METSELKRRLKAEICKLSFNKDRKRILEILHEYYMNLENAQRLDVCTRLIFFRCTYHIFDFLRKNNQLRRNVGRFNKELTNDFNKMLEELKDESS